MKSQTQKLIIPGELTDLNAYILQSDRAWQARGKLKKDNTETVAWLAKNQLTPIEKYPADFVFTWVCKNKRKDKDNISFCRKFIFDGLVEAGILENDGWKQIGNWKDIWKIDKDDPRIEVDIHS